MDLGPCVSHGNRGLLKEKGRRFVCHGHINVMIGIWEHKTMLRDCKETESCGKSKKRERK